MYTPEMALNADLHSDVASDGALKMEQLQNNRLVAQAEEKLFLRSSSRDLSGLLTMTEKPEELTDVFPCFLRCPLVQNNFSEPPEPLCTLLSLFVLKMGPFFIIHACCQNSVVV